MKSLFDDQLIEFPCQNCNKKIQKSVGWLKRNRRFTCTCGVTTDIDASQLKRELRKIEMEFSKLERTLKNFGK